MGHSALDFPAGFHALLEQYVWSHKNVTTPHKTWQTKNDGCCFFNKDNDDSTRTYHHQSRGIYFTNCSTPWLWTATRCWVVRFPEEDNRKNVPRKLVGGTAPWRCLLWFGGHMSLTPSNELAVFEAQAFDCVNLSSKLKPCFLRFKFHCESWMWFLAAVVSKIMVFGVMNYYSSLRAADGFISQAIWNSGKMLLHLCKWNTFSPMLCPATLWTLIAF